MPREVREAREIRTLYFFRSVFNVLAVFKVWEVKFVAPHLVLLLPDPSFVILSIGLQVAQRKVTLFMLVP